MEAAKSEKSSRSLAVEKLMRKIPFTEMDLEANQRFKMSRTQKERLKPKVDLYFILTIIATFVLSVMTAAIAYAGMREPTLFIFTVLFGIATLAGIIGFILSFRVKLQLISREGVKTVSGKVYLEIFYSGEHKDIPNYRMTINHVKFRLSEEIYDTFNNENFRVYYFRILHNEILSAEDID